MVWSVEIRSAGRTARVRGSISLNLVPSPSLESMIMEPFKLSILVLTTSSPTPRPDTSVAFLAVDTPEAKMRSIASASVSFAAAWAEISPFLTAESLMALGSSPLPSSCMAITM